MDLTNREYIYDRIQRFYLHLGLADKMLIDRAMREHNPTTLSDIAHFIRNHLVEFGYERDSKELKKLHEHQEQWLKDFAEYVFERYKNKG